MPPILARYKPENREDFELYKSELDIRNTFISKAWRYYEGKHDRQFRPDGRGVDFNVIVNITSQAIDKMVSFFSPDTPRIVIQGGEDSKGDLTTTVKSSSQLLIDAIWEDNELDTFIQDLAQSGFISGHSFVKIVDKGANNFPELNVLDPRNVSVFWNINNPKQVLYYRLTWRMSSDTSIIQDIIPNWLFGNINLIDPEDLLAGWTMIQYEVKAGKFKQQGFSTWEFPFPPIVAWKNAPSAHKVYGLSDLRHINLNDTLNFIIGNANKIIYHHAGPQTIVTGGELADGEEKKTGTSTIMEFPNPETQVFNLELRSDLKSSMQMAEDIRAAFFGQTRVVDMAQIRDNLARVTNFGVRMIHGDMLDMISARRKVYGTGISRITQIAAWLAGDKRVIDADVQVLFSDPLPVDRLTEVQALQVEAEISTLSQQTIAHDLKRDFNTEVVQTKEEEKAGLKKEPEPETEGFGNDAKPTES